MTYSSDYFGRVFYSTEPHLKKNIMKSTQPNLEHVKETFPLVEIVLEGNITFKDLIDTIDYQYNVPYTLVKADVEYFGKNNYGNILLELKGAKEINESAFQFFRKNKIKNKIKGYV
jgi:D-methionine transport system ATP-binding protein